MNIAKLTSSLKFRDSFSNLPLRALWQSAFPCPVLFPLFPSQGIFRVFTKHQKRLWIRRTWDPFLQKGSVTGVGRENVGSGNTKLPVCVLEENHWLHGIAMVKIQDLNQLPLQTNSYNAILTMTPK